jgi:hypothetical protein
MTVQINNFVVETSHPEKIIYTTANKATFNMNQIPTAVKILERSLLLVELPNPNFFQIGEESYEFGVCIEFKISMMQLNKLGTKIIAIKPSCEP